MLSSIVCLPACPSTVYILQHVRVCVLSVGLFLWEMFLVVLVGAAQARCYQSRLPEGGGAVAAKKANDVFISFVYFCLPSFSLFFLVFFLFFCCFLKVFSSLVFWLLFSSFWCVGVRRKARKDDLAVSPTLNTYTGRLKM